MLNTVRFTIKNEEITPAMMSGGNTYFKKEKRPIIRAKVTSVIARSHIWCLVEDNTFCSVASVFVSLKAL
ncbi:hypothetical protein LCGC14_1490070 [marine sediment metagenome]|uniref:Uncharacterized protein n=1 Tax=marine sediment metagenome TaxID=412755 RepID=A0A0F9JSW3_9ZZZZ